MTPRLTGTGQWVLVERFSWRSPGALIHYDPKWRPVYTGRVVAVGRLSRLHHPELLPGLTCFYRSAAGNDIEFRGRILRLMHWMEVLGIVEDEAADACD